MTEPPQDTLTEPPYTNREWFYSELYKVRGNLTEMCRRHKLNYDTTYAYAVRNHDLPLRRLRIDDNEKSRMHQLYAQGRTVREIAEELRRPDITVRRVLFGNYATRKKTPQLLHELAMFIFKHGGNNEAIMQALRVRQDRMSAVLPSNDVLKRAFGSLKTAIGEARVYLKTAEKDSTFNLFELPEHVAAAVDETERLRGVFGNLAVTSGLPQDHRAFFEAAVRNAFLKGVILQTKKLATPELAQLNQKMSNLRGQLKAAQQENQSLRGALKGVNSENATLKADLKALTGTENPSKAIAALDRKLQEAHKTIQSHNNEKQRVVKLENQLRALTLEHQKLKAEQEHLLKEAAPRRIKLAHFRARLRERYGIALSMGRVVQLDIEAQTLPLHGTLKNNGVLRLLTLYDAVNVYAVMTLDNHNAYVLTTCYTPSMLKASSFQPVEDGAPALCDGPALNALAESGPEITPEQEMELLKEWNSL